MARKNEYTDRVDKIIGERINELRISMGLSRLQLGEKIGITHQQLQKYEKNTNRVAAGRLADIARALKKPVAFFFDNIDDEQPELPTHHQRMCIEVSRNFLKLKNPKHQIAINDMLRRLANDE